MRAESLELESQLLAQGCASRANFGNVVELHHLLDDGSEFRSEHLVTLKVISVHLFALGSRLLALGSQLPAESPRYGEAIASAQTCRIPRIPPPFPMQNDVVAVTIKGVMPTANGCAVFLGTEEKTFVIYVDHSVGNAIQMTLNGIKRERPLTHDLIASILMGLGASLDHIVINDVNDGTFFARILLRMENELGKKIVEIDARPSDSIVLGLQHKRPLFVARKVFESVEDMTEILERVLKQQSAEEGDAEEET